MMASTAATFKDLFLMSGEAVGIFVIGLVVGIVGVIRNQKFKPKWSPSKERRFVEQHSRIHELLTEMRVTVRACRCLVFQLHNGGSFADGTSIKRFSVTHESCDMAIPSILLDSQDVLLTRYMDMVAIMDTQPSQIIKTDSLSPSAFRSGLEINNVEYFTVTPLKCLDGITPLGFVCCHWCSAEPLDAIEKEGISQDKLEQLISETAHEINTHLAYNAGKK
jgi:hypothetical protein